jgi:hypothetical protein
VNLLRVLTVSSVSAWVGVMVFFSLFVAPAAFSVLDRESAGRLVSAVFPRYYAVGLVLGLVGLAGLAGRLLAGERGPAPWALALLLLMLGLTAFTMLVLLPQLEEVRATLRAAGVAPGSGLPETRAFGRLHGLSLILNGVTLLAGLALLCLEALRARG